MSGDGSGEDEPDFPAIEVESMGKKRRRGGKRALRVPVDDIPRRAAFSMPPPAATERKSVPPPALVERKSVPPPALVERKSVPPPAAPLLEVPPVEATIDVHSRPTRPDSEPAPVVLRVSSLPAPRPRDSDPVIEITAATEEELALAARSIVPPADAYPDVEVTLPDRPSDVLPIERASLEVPAATAREDTLLDVRIDELPERVPAATEDPGRPAAPESAPVIADSLQDDVIEVAQLIVPARPREAEAPSARVEEIEFDPDGDDVVLETHELTREPVRPKPPPPPAEAPRSSLNPAPAPAAATPAAATAAAAPTPAESGAAKRKRGRAWWEQFFDDDYLRTVRLPHRDHIARQCDFIESRLGLARGASVLDLGCGLGLHAIELAKRGYTLTGIDLSLPMLGRAAMEARDEGVTIDWQHADMRDLAAVDAYDAVLCWGTTFGYFDDETNRSVIERIFRALKPMGSLLIESVNRDHVIAAQPNLVWFQGDGCICMEETDFNYITSRLHVKRTVQLDDGRKRDTEYAVRLYSLHEIGQLLHYQGFRVAEVSGQEATPSVFFGADSPRMLLLAERRAAQTGTLPKPPPASEG